MRNICIVENNATGSWDIRCHVRIKNILNKILCNKNLFPQVSDANLLFQFVSTKSRSDEWNILLVKKFNRIDNGKTNENFFCKTLYNHEARRNSLSCQGKLKVLMAMTKRCKTVELWIRFTYFPVSPISHDSTRLCIRLNSINFFVKHYWFSFNQS